MTGDRNPVADGGGTADATGGDPVTIDELRVDRAPGFEAEGFAIDGFCPGINLVHGPNGAGKTTTADAILRLLWPEAATDGEELVGYLSLNGSEYRVEAAWGDADYQRDGQEATAPASALPPADHRHRYRLSLHDLLQEETRNESFAETIERESAGGFDLSDARDERGYDDSATTRHAGVYQDAEAAVETWREERRDAEELADERRRLSTLRDDLAAATGAQREAAALEQAIDYREAVSEHEDATAELETFPDVLERVDGDEIEELDAIEDEIDDWRERKQVAEEKRRDAVDDLDDVDLPEGGVSDGVVARLTERRDALADAESRVGDAESELEGAEAQRRSACEDVPLTVDHDDLVDLEPGAWADVAAFSREAEALEAARQRRDAIERWADADPAADADERTLERGRNALEDWLMAGADAGDAAAEAANAAFRVGVAAAALVGAAGIALGALVNPLLAGVGVAGLVLFAYAYRQRQAAAEPGSDRSSHRESLEQTGLAPPASWTVEDVRARLDEFREQLANHAVVAEREQQGEAAFAEDDLAEQASDVEATRAALRESLGAAPETTDVELAVIVRRVLAWQDAHDEVVRLEAELADARQSMVASRSALREELAEYGYEEVPDAATAREHVQDLDARQSTHATATWKLEEAEETIEEARETLADRRAAWRARFTAFGIDPGDRDALASLCEQVDAYETASREIETKGEIVDRERAALRSLPAADSELESAERPELERRLDDATATAERYDELRDRITGIETKIDEAKTDDSLEDAITGKERALDALESRLDDDYASTVGDVLVDHVREQTIGASRPAVFRRADEILATITRGRYELLLGEDDDETFRARDTTTQRGLALDELSSGTRVQVLLAVRLAFVERQESGAQFPLVLDETLANADDVRAGVIVEAVIELARAGRQVFYFTAQGDEVAKWRAALDGTDASDETDAGDGTDAVEWTTIDLADARELDGAVRVPEFDETATLAPDPPAPDDHDRASYADAAGVDPFDPYSGPETAHLWYVVDDVAVLAAFLELGIERWGQLATLLERGGEEIVPADAETLREIRQSAAGLDAFARAWRIGRGDPVDRSVLEASGAVSDNYIDRVSELADDLGGDGERLVEALYASEVDGFWQSKAEELEGHLREDGYVVSRAPLGHDEIGLRVTQQLVDAGVDRSAAAERASDLIERASRNEPAT